MRENNVTTFSKANKISKKMSETCAIKTGLKSPIIIDKTEITVAKY